MSDAKPFRLPLILSLLSVIGIALSFISLYHHTALKNQIDLGASFFCNVSATINCDAVNKSQWSYVLGIPVASYAIFFYGSVLLFSLLLGTLEQPARAAGAAVALALGFWAVFISVLLFAVSELFIRALCPVCLGLYVVNILIFIAALFSRDGTPFGTRLGNGNAAILTSPKFFADPSDAKAQRGAVLMAMGLIFLAYIAFTLPDVILVRLLLPVAVAKGEQANQEATQKAEQRAIEDWNTEESIAIPPSKGSGALGDYSQGPEDAPIQMVEFSDFECPYCRKFYFEIDHLLNQYKGKLHFTFRNFPLDNACNPTIPQEFHHNSCHAAIFSRCAGEQGKFWDALGYLFTLPEFDNESSKEDVAAAIDHGVEKLALDGEAMHQCMLSDRPRTKLLEDIETAAAAGLEGTPFLIVNGKVVKMPTANVMRAIFDSILTH